jgi:alkanesulfonate monooxygenase SsuD/methylene tetrahydromethanopterin reductase-like flavin-dependent oxidoreductase (luciferase family)
MLAEAVALIRELWKGETVDHDGEHYVVENARIYTLPPYTPDILMSGFGPKVVQVAAEIADGFITTSPSAGLPGQLSQDLPTPTHFEQDS